MGKNAQPQQACGNGDAEAGGTEQAGLEKVYDFEIGMDGTPGLFEEHRQRRHRGVEKHQPPLSDQPGGDQRHQQHGTEPAANAAADMHQQDQHQNVGQYLQAQLQIEVLMHQPQTGQREDRRQQVETGNRTVEGADAGSQNGEFR